MSVRKIYPEKEIAALQSIYNTTENEENIFVEELRCKTYLKSGYSTAK